MSKDELRNMTAHDYAKYRIEMTRRGLMELLAAVEHGTEYGRRLSGIIESVISNVEALYEEAVEYDESEEGYV